MNKFLSIMGSLAPVKKKINDLDRDYKTMGFAKPVQDPQKSYGVGTMGNIVNKEFGRMTSTSLAGPMGFDFMEVLSHPSAFIEDQAKSYEADIRNYAEANLPPEIYDKASNFIADNSGLPKEQLMKLVMEKFNTPENQQKATGAGVEAFALRVGNESASLLKSFQDGGVALMFKTHPNFMKGSGIVGALFLARFLIGKMGR